MRKYLLHILIISFLIISSFLVACGETEGVVEHEDLKGIKTDMYSFVILGDIDHLL